VDKVLNEQVKRHIKSKMLAAIKRAVWDPIPENLRTLLLVLGIVLLAVFLSHMYDKLMPARYTKDFLSGVTDIVGKARHNYMLSLQDKDILMALVHVHHAIAYMDSAKTLVPDLAEVQRITSVDIPQLIAQMRAQQKSLAERVISSYPELKQTIETATASTT